MADLTAEQKAFCRKYGFDETTFKLGLDQGPPEAAHGAQGVEDGLPVIVLNAALTAQERAFCAEMDMTPSTFLLGKVGRVRYDAALVALSNGPAAALQALCGNDAAGLPVFHDGLVLHVNGAPAFCPSFPLV
jgi:hypothetical protein